MGLKIGETSILRGTPPVTRTLEVFVDEDWLVSESLEKCVSFREAGQVQGRTVVIFSRSVSAAEARAFAELLNAAVDVLEAAERESSPEE